MPVRTTDLARALECDPTMISRWARRGMPTDNVESARAWQASNIRSRVRIGSPPPAAPSNRPTKATSGPAATTAAAAGAAGSPEADAADAGSYNEYRTRRERAEASLAELRLGETRGELIRLSAVKNALGTAFATAREALLQIADRLAPQLAGESDPRAVHSVLYGEIHKTLLELAGAGDRLGQPAAEGPG